MIFLIFLVLCPFLIFFIIKKIGWKLFLIPFIVLILLLVIYLNKVNISESFNCFERKPIKIEHIYDRILWTGNDGNLEIEKIYIVKDFCDCKENIKEVLNFYKNMPKADSIIYVTFFKNNDFFNGYLNNQSFTFDKNDWEYVDEESLISFTNYKRDINKNTIFICETDNVLDYEFLEKDAILCNINMKYSEINRETLQKILNTVDKMSFHKKIEKFTYKIQNSISKPTEIIIAFNDFGKTIDLEIR